MTLPTPSDISAWIAAELDCQHLHVDGDGQHFQALIVSSAFEGLSKVKRHQAVYNALGARMAGDIHALSMRTMTPAEFDATK